LLFALAIGKILLLLVLLQRFQTLAKLINLALERGEN
jgi:hypothetical protein